MTPSTCEWYELYPGTVAPNEGELFVLEWRSKIEEFVGGWVGTTVSVYSDDCWAVSFVMNDNTIRSVYEVGVSADFEPDEFHEFELRSFDMRAYALYIDGSIAIEGSFWESLFSNRIGWGESAPGSTCLSRWDCFRFGVVPEPNPALLLGVGLLVRRDRG
ncbi:MAG: hypothetical protein JSW71_05525 [Gemmatimonadota bacterium]|nr:MAG: hypothetical protein JSW71_05525 [Gemmatimonadota bacterium]